MNERIFNKDIENLREPERVERSEIERVIELCLEAVKIESVLDVGTGTGLFAEYFDQAGLKVCGIDINPKMIETAKEFVPRGEFKIAKAEEIPYPEKSFDLVFFGYVLHELEDYLKALKEAKRVCRKRVCILEWQHVKEDFGPPIEHRLKANQIISWSKQAGFSNVEEIKLTHLLLFRLEI